MGRRFGFICGMILAANAGLFAAPACANTIPSLGDAANFGVLGLNNAFYSIQSATTINGGIGIAQGGSVNVQSGTVKGTATEAAFGQITNAGTITGGIVINPTQMSNANTAAQNAYDTAVANTATQTFGAINSTTTITGNGRLNVVNVSSVNLFNSSLTLSGSSSDIFVLRVSGNFTFSGASSLLLSANVRPENVLIVFTGSGQTINIGIGTNAINGTLLAPSASTNWQLASGTFNGEIIIGTPLSGGGVPANLNNITVNSHGFRPVPEPSSFVLAGIGSCGLVWLTRRARTRRMELSQCG